jgi:c(7)-type cytochrome triheme protein
MQGGLQPNQISPFFLDESPLLWVDLKRLLEALRLNHSINLKGGENVGMKFGKAAIIIICILCLVSIGVGYAQQQKVGGGDIKYEAKGSPGAVIFSHENHVNEYKLKCTGCHPKIFKAKKGLAKMSQCAVCHDGKKAFSAADQKLCTNCHKK